MVLDKDQMEAIAREQMEADQFAGVQSTGHQESEPDPLPTLVSVFTSERKPLSDKGTEHLVGMVFQSSSGGRPHIVTLQPNGWVTCTCEAMLSIESRPTGCWSMKEFRAIKGLPTP